jgi:hypothetical protein
MARNLKAVEHVPIHDYLTFQGGHSMAEQRRGDQERTRPEHQEQSERTPRRENDPNEQGGSGGGRQTPNNPQRRQGS